MSKTAVITGASGGVGKVYAQRLASQGFDLILTGRRKDKLENLTNDLTQKGNIKITFVIADLSNDQDLEHFIKVIQADGNIEMLVNSAGFGPDPKPFMELDEAVNEQMIKLHQIALLRLIKAVVPEMEKHGKGTIINVASIVGFVPALGWSLYCATKAFQISFSETLFLELKPKGIQVQVLCPGTMNTDFARDFTEEHRKALLAMVKGNLQQEAVVDYSLKSLKNKNKVICEPPGRQTRLHKLSVFVPRTLQYRVLASRRNSAKKASKAN